MCRELAVKRDDPMSQPVTQTAVANAGNRCPGFMEVCRGTSNDSAVIITVSRGRGDRSLSRTSFSGTTRMGMMLARHSERQWPWRLLPVDRTTN